MNKDNGIGELWALNFGEEGKPKGVGSVWIANSGDEGRPNGVGSVWLANEGEQGRPYGIGCVWNTSDNDSDCPNGVGIVKILNMGSTPPTPQLPDYTIRLKYKEGTTPTFSKGTGVLVDADNNIWDLTYENSDWSNLFYGKNTMLEVLCANTSKITNMANMFYNCSSLTTVPLFDTSNVTNTNYMFGNCYLLTTVPLFDTSNVTNMSQMFRNCYKVESGALALYQQTSTQETPPTSHTNTFYNCGRDTETGSAELAQIPTSWGGTLSE